jgi:histidyl-tRNA synthetase
VTYSLGGGGRYDGMIGRFLGQQVPAVGFSIGFERIVDLVAEQGADAAQAIVLIHDADVAVTELLAHKAALLRGGAAARVRLERRTKNLKALLERSASDGYTGFASVRAGDEPGAVEVKPLS